MRIFIPAAGRGTRLQPMTHFSPKCMIDIEGKPLLYYLLSPLKQLGVSEVFIVTGYLGNMIEEYVRNNPNFPFVTCIHNDKYDSTNSIMSIAHTMHLWNEDFCIIDSDLLIRPELLKELISAEEACLFIDNSKFPDTIDMKVQVRDGKFVYMDKKLLRKDTSGEFFGLSRWTPDLAHAFRNTIESLISRGETNVWYEWAIRELAITHEIPVKTCSWDKWYEIDNSDDYLKATNFAAQWRNDWLF